MASSSNPTPPSGVPNSTPPPPHGASNTTPTPPSETPSSNPTLPPVAPNATLTPSSATPSSDPALSSGVPNTTPTPPSGAPSSPTSSPAAPDTTPTPPSGASSSPPTSSPAAPDTTPTPPSGAPSSPPTSSPAAPDTTPTPSSKPPNTTPTPSSGAPNSNHAPTLGAPSTAPTSPSGAPLSGTSNANSTPPSAGAPNTAPTPASSSNPTPPSGPHNTTPTPPSGALSSNPIPTSGAPNTTPTPPSGTPNITPTPPSGASSSNPAPPSGGSDTTPTTPPPKTSKTTQAPPLTPVEETLQKQKDEVLIEVLKSTETTRITLYGETGVGKTWMAREIFKKIPKYIHEAGEKALIACTLWLSLNKRSYPSITRSTTLSLLILEDIARQLCVLPSVEGGFEDDDSDDDDKDDSQKYSEIHQDDHHQEEQKGPEKERKDPYQSVKEAVSKKLNSEKKENKFVVLILDGVSETMDVENKIISNVEPLKNLREKNSLKVIVIRSTTTKTGTANGSTKEFLIESLKEGDFLKLLESSAGTEGINRMRFNKDDIFRDSGVVSLPAAVAVLVGKALKYNLGELGDRHEDQEQYYSRYPEAFENDLGEARKRKEAEKIRSLLIRYAFDTLPSNKDEVVTKCCWHSRKFFELSDNSSVHYNELISHWIMEGYLDATYKYPGVEVAYEEGYRVLKELLKRSLLKVEDDDFISMEGLALKVPDNRRKGFDDTAMLGLPAVFAGDREWKGLGKVAVADGMIKSVCKHKKWRLATTLIIDGSRLCREVPGTFFKPMVELQVLVLLNPKLKSLDFIGGGGGEEEGEGEGKAQEKGEGKAQGKGEGKAEEKGEASPLSNLRLLVLRECEVLENVDSIKTLESLVVLEISGAKLLKTMSEDLFVKMSQLRSLNFSGVQIKSLPFSFYNLTKLRWLILRDCSSLESMPSLKAFEDLEVLDMSGSSSLTKFRDKKFGNLKKLRVLDFSDAKIAPLPFVHTLNSLTRFTLKGCTEITRLPHLEDLPKLQVLELPGAKKFIEFYRIENKKDLRILDLSETDLSRLPPTLGDLPCLEVLNLSHMSSLKDFEGVSFSKLTSLKCLNLSNTKVESLPSLSNLSSLRQLLLRDCQHLAALPEMKGLTSLEILDLSQAAELKEIRPDQVLELNNLRQLLLRDCKKLEKLPNLNDLTKLEVLNLSGCEALKELEKQSFEGMSLLQELDLSRTKVQSLPSLHLSSNLRRLLLENCTELGEFNPPSGSLSKLEVLSLCGAKSLQKPEAKYFHLALDCKSLQILNLSETSMVLSFDFDKCTNLKKLSLGGCIFLNTKPKLEKLTMLEVLDLSGTSVVQPKSGNNLTKWSELINSTKPLTLEELSGDLQRLFKLTNLDLWGLEVKEFPDWISRFVHLKRLRLPNLAAIQQLDWGKIKRLPDDLNWEECGIFKNPGINHHSSCTPSISLSSIKFLQLLKQQSEIWKKCFKQFRIYVCPSVESGKVEDVYCRRDDIFFENIYLQAICCQSCNRFLEIRGFKNAPDGLNDALSEVDCLSFIEDDFITSVSDLGVENMEVVTGLWLERCAKVEFIFSEEKAIKFGEGFNILWASNLPLLNKLCKGNLQVQSFQNLKQLYLDCCPKLEYVFASSHELPKKLEKLQVKFCDKLKALLESKSSADQEGAAASQDDLPQLSELHLLELPELTSVGVKLPSLQNAKVKGCPKLKKQEFLDGLGWKNKTVEITNVEENWERNVHKEAIEYYILGGEVELVLRRSLLC